MIHIFEYPEGAERKNLSNNASKIWQHRNKTEEIKNEYRLIKKFARSAAGTNMRHSKNDLRHPLICQKTSNYLIYE